MRREGGVARGEGGGERKEVREWRGRWSWESQKEGVE